MAKGMTNNSPIKKGGKTTNYSSRVGKGSSTLLKSNQKSITDLRTQNKKLLSDLRTAKGDQRKLIQKQLKANNKLITKMNKQMYKTVKRNTKSQTQIARSEADVKKFAYGSMAESATSAVGGGAGVGITAVSKNNQNLVDVAQKSNPRSGRDEDNPEDSDGQDKSIADLINSLGGKFD